MPNSIAIEPRPRVGGLVDRGHGEGAALTGEYVSTKRAPRVAVAGAAVTILSLASACVAPPVPTPPVPAAPATLAVQPMAPPATGPMRLADTLRAVLERAVRDSAFPGAIVVVGS